MTERRGPRDLPRGMISGFVRGAGYPIEALGFMTEHRLWPLAAAAIAVNVLLLVALVAAALWWAFPLVGQWVAAMEGWAAGSHLLGALVAAGAWLLWILAIGGVLGLSALTLLMVGQAVASPFLDLLSEKVETIVLGTPPVPFSVGRLLASIWMALGDVVWSLVYWVLANIPLFLLGFVLPPVSAVLSFLFSALLIAQELVGLSLARRLVPFRVRWRMLRGSRSLAVGLGSAATVLFAVPGLNLVLLPITAVGGTLLYCDLEAARRLDDRGQARARVA